MSVFWVGAGPAPDSGDKAARAIYELRDGKIEVITLATDHAEIETLASDPDFKSPAAAGNRTP